MCFFTYQRGVAWVKIVSTCNTELRDTMSVLHMLTQGREDFGEDAIWICQELKQSTKLKGFLQGAASVYKVAQRCV